MEEQKDVFRKEYKELTEEQKIDIQAIKAMAEELDCSFIGCDKMDPRCLSLAKTKLAECVMWAVKGVTK